MSCAYAYTIKRKKNEEDGRDSGVTRQYDKIDGSFY
jgi:hypothetical protein